jgi:hypothetical protein
LQKTIYIAVAFMLLFYLFPWLVNPGVSLSLNAYDLAEWASLHPAVRNATPTLLTSLLLRLPLACLALLIAFTTRRGLFPALIVLIAALALLPPPEFIKALDDPNYRQQAALALLTLIGGVIGLSEILPRLRHLIAAALGLLGALACIIGLFQSYDLMRDFNLPTQIGMGGALLTLIFIIVAGVEVKNHTG